ncbi:WhiB family transcriptional regulator [Streptomyces sp. V4-01]|uniref:WhiB family transcriptional regulator n=1 Tax=Actinacidiphila polyblastidii TaxID=3110430 RepID=A0ABU7PKY8_9ACTN|nr:WhiB family transcriptional regulator [Streptomyces sp. V4-01]
MTTTGNALCTTEIRTHGDLWFSTNPAERDHAKLICRRCPLIAACRQAGLDLGDHARGVWGGLSSGDRRVLRTGEHAPDPDDEGDDSVRRRPRQACGTEAALRAHRLAKEACEMCETAHAVLIEADRWARLATLHGTDAGHRMHRVLRDAPCDDCRAAAIRQRAVNRARHREEARAAWERRGAALEASWAVA